MPGTLSLIHTFIINAFNKINHEYDLMVVGSSVCLPSHQLIEACSPDHAASPFYYRQRGKFYKENQPYYCCRV
ncbi:hypothetical protein E2C01_022436 [Portunus trituberculatus]|uniref:Uncharacterized protein n=1 Tax=Portunus trituberculatus TaxID=210409 RepID=A0A5B7E8X0_PORTR|nr:hypothetical protein [Portunus trituberculatus]